MKYGDMILASEFCIHHNIDLSLIQSLNESGLIETITIEEKVFVPETQLSHLEKMILLHNEMNINVEGIETINYLLERINSMQQQIQLLANKLRRFEDN